MTLSLALWDTILILLGLANTHWACTNQRQLMVCIRRIRKISSLCLSKDINDEIPILKRLEGLSNERLAKKAFNQLKQNHDNNHYDWVSQAFASLEEYNVLVTDCDSKIKYEIKEFHKNKLKQNLISCIDQRKKLRTYASNKIRRLS